jgi:hypothetical protein
VVDQIVGEVKLKADTKDAEAGAKRVQESFTGAMIKSQLATQALSKAVDLLVSGITSTFKAAEEYRVGVEKLTRALSSAGHDAKYWVDILEQESSALQKRAGISDDTIRDLQTMATNLGVMPSEMEKYIEAAIRMSRATGRDLNGSLESLIKLETGVVDRTLKVIPEIDNLTKAQLLNGDAVNVINERWDEFLDVSDTVSGGLTTLRLSYEDLLETIGKNISDDGTVIWALSKANSLLETIDKYMGQHAKWARFRDEWAPAEEETGGGGKIVGTHTVTEEISRATRKSAKKSGKSKQAPLRDLGGGGGIDEGVIMLGGLPYDPVSGQFLPPEPPDPAKIKAAVDQYQDDIFASIEVRREKHSQRMAEFADKDLAYAIAKDEERAANYQWMTDTMMGAAESFTNAGVGLLMDLAGASGEQQAIILKQFLSSTGEQLIGMGIRDSFAATSELIGSYGMSPKGWALLAMAGAEIAGGAAMMGGSTAISVPSGGGGGGGTGAVASGGGSSAAGNLGQMGGDRMSNTTVIIYGEPSARLGVIVRDSVALAANRGV